MDKPDRMACPELLVCLELLDSLDSLERRESLVFLDFKASPETMDSPACLG